MEIKKATSVEEQITKLKDRGIIIQDEEKAKEILLDIGYFRLGFYCFPFEKNYPNKNNRYHAYKVDTQLLNVVCLYYFDYELRNILFASNPVLFHPPDFVYYCQKHYSYGKEYSNTACKFIHQRQGGRKQHPGSKKRDAKTCQRTSPNGNR